MKPIKLNKLSALVIAALPLIYNDDTLALEVDNVEALPEPVRGLYAKTDTGKFRLKVSGLDDTTGLKSALEKERQTAKETKRMLREMEEKFNGVDPELFKAVMSKFDSAEEAQLLKDGKLDELVTRRTEKMKGAHMQELTKLQKQIEQANARAAKYQERVLDNYIRAAASKTGVHEHAVEDALFRGRSMFKLDDDGNAVQLDNAGNVVMGADGKTPFNPEEWLSSMKTSAPHWFKADSSGGGASGGTGGAGGGKTMSRAAFQAMDGAAQSKYIKDGGKLVD